MAEEGVVEGLEPHYTVFVRFPFNRPGEFVDPPLVDWDDTRDRELWQILAATPRGSDIDWRELALQFEVTLEFILQQAAFLYSQNLLQVKAQMRRAGRTSSLSGTATGGPSSASPTSGLKVGSLEGKRSPSALLIRPAGERSHRASQEGSTPSTPVAAIRPNTISRNPSVTTITQSRPGGTGGARTGSRGSGRGSFSRGQFSQYREAGSHFKSSAAARTANEGKRDDSHSAVEEESLSDDSSSSSSSSEAPATARSQMFRRGAGRLASARAREPTSSEDDDDGPTFLPAEGKSLTLSGQPPPGAYSSVRPAGSAKGKERERAETNTTTRIESMSEASSASEAAPVKAAPQAVLSPRRQGELAGLVQSPTKSVRREGSEGSPSMGSSFSDLENASVTQSALEEEAASFLNKGGSRMSNLSRAFGM